ncbi:hypothetical protein BBP40_011685 [Aspergillus hancockii]|nr:hypothetical protein BBP40_011685 [Aspergillus hancockii]
MTHPAMVDMLEASLPPPVYDPCFRPLNRLTKMLIKDLLIEKHHWNRHVLVRTITPCYKGVALTAWAEDERGDILMLRLYNQDDKRGKRDMQVILEQGTIVAVKQPYLRVMSEFHFGLHVYHASDAVFMAEFRELVPSCWRATDVELRDDMDWKRSGDSFSNMLRYHAAIDCYTRALECHSPMNGRADIIRSRAFAFCESGQFDAALSDFRDAPPVDAQDIICQARAYYSLEKYEDSSATLRCFRSSKRRKRAEINTEHNRLLARMNEKKYGEYRFRDLRAAAEAGTIHLDRATYIGPVERKWTDGGRGRGLFTTKGVKAGDLLLCEKAFAIVTHPYTPGEIESDDLISAVVQKLHRNPSLVSEFYELNNGGYNKPVGIINADGRAVVDTFLVREIVRMNSFCSPLSLRHELVNSILRGQESQIPYQGGELHGIWRCASYINHSCYYTAERAIIGDMMAVRACRDLPVGTEITIPYVVVSVDVEERQRSFHAWDFECQCIICLDQRSTAKNMALQRKSLIANFWDCQNTADIAMAKSVMVKLPQTYARPGSEVPQIEIVASSLAMLRWCVLREPSDAFRFALQTLVALGFDVRGVRTPDMPGSLIEVRKWGLVSFSTVQCWLLLATAYHLKENMLWPQALDFAKVAYRICVGEDESFDVTRQELAQRIPDLYSFF